MPILQLKMIFEELGTTEPVLLKWSKQVGDWICKNEELAVCSGNGQQISLKAPNQGLLHKILIDEGTTFAPGNILGILRTVMGGT
jgi:pyruvate/2-oxoglutarate dehydrogenase complex dihydrolipoamide acyltransferase (E2) component